MRKLIKQDPWIFRIAADGFTHNYYKNKYILIVRDSHLKSGWKQLKYYKYNIKLANNYLASCFLLDFRK